MKLRVLDLLSEAWERFLLYLPLVVMAALALSTYWMVHTQPTAEAPRPREVSAEGPDYFLEKFTVQSFDAKGQLRSEVSGDRARHFPQQQWLEIDNILIRSFDNQGRLTTAAARRGLTNDDGSQVQLMGDALVLREAQPARAGTASSPRTEYRGEFLHAYLREERIESHKPVVITRGADRFSADRLSFDNVEQVVQLDGRVRVTLVPPPRQTAP